MTYIYTYKSQDYRSYYEVTHLSDFKAVSFPKKESMITDEVLLSHGITRREYITPVPSLEAAKSNKIQELTRARDAIESNNISTDKGEFEFDSLSRTRLSNAMNAMTDTDTREWTTSDGVTVSMSKFDFLAIFSAASRRSDTAYAKLQRLKTQVDSCKTHEEVEAITWDEN